MASKVQQQINTDCIIEMQHPTKGQTGEFRLSDRSHIKPERCQRQARR